MLSGIGDARCGGLLVVHLRNLCLPRRRRRCCGGLLVVHLRNLRLRCRWRRCCGGLLVAHLRNLRLPRRWRRCRRSITDLLHPRDLVINRLQLGIELEGDRQLPGLLQIELRPLVAAGIAVGGGGAVTSLLHQALDPFLAEGR